VMSMPLGKKRVIGPFIPYPGRTSRKPARIVAS